MASEKVEKILKIPVQDIAINKEDMLGRGGYGQVFSGLHEGKKVAVKLLIDKGLVPNSEKKDMEREAHKLLELRGHPRIIHFYGALMEENYYGLVIEYMHFGSSFIFVVRFHVEAPLLLRIAKDVASAMEYLHSFTPPMLHKDLKADNVLIDNHFNAKVCDFGLSKWKTITKSMTQDKPSNGPRCTISHIAPEVLENINCKFTKEIDVYAFGITVWELFAQRRPYEEALNNAIIRTLVCENQRPNPDYLCEDCPEIINLMLCKCWHQNADQRPQFHVVFKALEKAYKEREHEINRIIKSLRRQICEQFSENDPRYIDTKYIDGQQMMTDDETDLLSVNAGRLEEPSELPCLKPIGEHLLEFNNITTTANSGASGGSSGEAVWDFSDLQQQLKINDNSIQTSDSQYGISPEAKAGEIIEKPDYKIGAITEENGDNQHIGDKHQQRNEKMIDTVTEQNKEEDQNREKEMEQEKNKDQYVVRPKETKMPDSFPVPSVVNLKNAGDVLQGLRPFSDTAPNRELMPEQPNSSLEIDEPSKKGTFGPVPPKRSYADPLNPRPEIPPNPPASNIQPQPRPAYINTGSNRSHEPPNTSESMPRYPPKYWDHESGGGTPPPNPTPPMGGATGMEEPIVQPGRLTISHQHSRGGFTHITMDPSSNFQPSVQVGDRNIMVVGGCRDSYSDDEQRREKTSTKKKSKKKRHCEIQLPDTPVTRDDVDIVCVDIGKDWKRLCRGLGLDDPRIEQIEQDYHINGQYEMMYQSLKVWQNKMGKAATTKALGQCLSNIDRDDLIKKLKDPNRD